MNPSIQPDESVLDRRARLQREIGERYEQINTMENAINWARFLAGLRLVAANGGWLDVSDLTETTLRAYVETPETGYGDDHPFQRHFGLEGYHDGYHTEQTDLAGIEGASVGHNDGILDIRVSFEANGFAVFKRFCAELKLPLKNERLKRELTNLHRLLAEKEAEIAAMEASVS